MRPLKVALVNQKNGKDLESILQKGRYPIEIIEQFIPQKAFENHTESAIDEILKCSPHTIIIPTSYFGNERGDILARKFKRSRDNVVIGTYDREEIDKNRAKNIPIYSLRLIRSGEIDDIWSYNETPRSLIDLIIRKSAFPSSAAVVGMGHHGFLLAGILSEDDRIEEVNIYSEHGKREGYGSIKNLFEKGYKIIPHKNLSDCIRGTDYVAFCQSALLPGDQRKKPAKLDRSDLLKYEGDLMMSYASAIPEGYKGLITVITNPVGELLNLTRRVLIRDNKLEHVSDIPDDLHKRINQFQLTSPMKIDLDRVLKALRPEIEGEEDKERYHISNLTMNSLMGIHGEPFMRSLNPNLDYNIPCEEIIKKMKEAVKKSIEIGWDAMQSSKETNYPTIVSQGANASFFMRLKHLPREPGFPAYSFYDSTNNRRVQAYLGLPVNFGENCSAVIPNGEVTRYFTKDTNHRLHSLAERQNKNVDEFLKSRGINL